MRGNVALAFFVSCVVTAMLLWSSLVDRVVFQAASQSHSGTPARTFVSEPHVHVKPQSGIQVNRSPLVTANATDAFCSWSLMAQYGTSFTVDQVDAWTIRVTPSGGNTTDLFVSGRAVGPSMVGVVASFDVGSHYIVGFDGKMWDEGRYEADVVVSWISDRYLGQRWSLPNRNDNPPLEEMKRKCTALTLEGRGCDRFGIVAWSGDFVVTSEQVGSVPPKCDWNGPGRWVSAPTAGPLLDDPVGLNRVGDHALRWQPAGCAEPLEREAHRVIAQMRAAGIHRLALFGDSMLVEQFHMLHSFLAPETAIHQGKHRRLRSMEFSSDNVTIKFFRSYTTGGGHSIIAPPSTVLEQLSSFGPDAVVGNLAVLHWQQNMRSLRDWTAHLNRFSELFRNAFGTKLVGRAWYFGPTLIQMGRTQGLEPKRTASFAAAARKSLRGFEFFDPMNMSVPRRESAFDGQHWACYHRHGGVSHSINQLLLRNLVP